MRRAFTLAEVLITLGIIGVVAAMTIPNLIAEHQKRATVTKLQKAISVINQAYRLSYEENGDLTAEEAKTLGAEEYFKKYWEPYIKVHTLCTTYQICNYKSETPFKFSNGSQYQMIFVSNNTRIAFQTMDGFLFIILISGGVDNLPMSSLFVDINGAAGPNRLGRDVFVLERISDGKGVQPNGYDKDNNMINSVCRTTGNTCAEKIKRAGWKIDGSYRWK